MARPPESSPSQPPAGLSFEEALARVEEITARVEAGEVGLEQSVVEYERAMSLLRHCRAVLTRAEQRVRELSVAAGDADAPPPVGRSEGA